MSFRMRMDIQQKMKTEKESKRKRERTGDRSAVAALVVEAEHLPQLAKLLLSAFLWEGCGCRLRHHGTRGHGGRMAGASSSVTAGNTLVGYASSFQEAHLETARSWACGRGGTLRLNCGIVVGQRPAGLVLLQTTTVIADNVELLSVALEARIPTSRALADVSGNHVRTVLLATEDVGHEASPALVGGSLSQTIRSYVARAGRWREAPSARTAPLQRTRRAAIDSTDGVTLGLNDLIIAVG